MLWSTSLSNQGLTHFNLLSKVVMENNIYVFIKRIICCLEAQCPHCTFTLRGCAWGCLFLRELIKRSHIQMDSMALAFLLCRYAPLLCSCRAFSAITTIPYRVTYSMYVMTPTLHMSVGKETKS